MPVTETELPGVGAKHEVDLDDGSTLIVITHNTGKREVYRRPDPDVDSEKLFEVSDSLARTIGSILEGAYFQPVESGERETMLAEDTLIEWFDVTADSPIAGKTLDGADVRVETGATVVAIHRDDGVLASPRPDTTIEADDTLVVVGSKENVAAFETLVTGVDDTE